MMDGLTVGSAFTGTHNGKQVWIAQASYTDEDGRRRFIRGMGATEQQALQRRQKNLSKRLASPSRVYPTVSTLLGRWIASYGPRDISDEVRRKHLRNIEIHVIPRIGSVRLIDLTRARVETFFSHELSELPDGAWRNVYKSFRTMLMYAVRHDLIPSNPMTGLKQRTYVATVRDDDIQLIEKRTNIAQDILRWLKENNHEWSVHYPFVLFSFLGLRRSELLGLTWKCVDDFESQAAARIHVRQQLTRAKGKGWFIEPRTKNNKSRTIYLPDEWWVQLTDLYLREYPTIGDWRDDLLFRRRDGMNFTYTDYQNLWDELFQAYENRGKPRNEWKPVPEGKYWRAHYNRHITASMMFREGQNLQYVQEILGHSDSIMTLHYTHFFEKEKRDAMIAYGKAFETGDWSAAQKVDFQG